jgi:hypothetical protein
MKINEEINKKETMKNEGEKSRKSKIQMKTQKTIHLWKIKKKRESNSKTITN